MIEEIIEKAKKSGKKVYIYAHKYPDGDAICSSKALAEYLKRQGIDAQYVVTNYARAFKKIIGEIPTTTSVEKDGISIVLDTNKKSYAENTLFEESLPEDTYVIDHHEKSGDNLCIEDELGLPKENVIRDPNASSVCEILLNELKQDKISLLIADILTLGLMKDTANLKVIKSDTLKSLANLLQLGADYNTIVDFCRRKPNLRETVGLAQMLLKTKTFPIGDTFGMLLSVDKDEVDELRKNFGCTNPQKKIFKMLDVENCSFVCLIAENTSGEYDAELRNSQAYGNLNVLQLATMHNGGGHHNASGFKADIADEYGLSDLEQLIQSEAVELYSESATDIPQVVLDEKDEQLRRLLDKTKRFTKGVMPETLLETHKLVKAGAKYDYVFKSYRSFEKYMLQNELLSRIPASVYTKMKPMVDIRLSQDTVDELTQRYKVSEEEILSVIDMFSDIYVRGATIRLPSGKSAIMYSDGNVKIRDESATKADAQEK